MLLPIYSRKCEIYGVFGLLFVPFVRGESTSKGTYPFIWSLYGNPNLEHIGLESGLRQAVNWLFLMDGDYISIT